MSAYVYITSNFPRTVLYTGSSRVLKDRSFEHKKGKGSQFTKKYRCFDIVYYEMHDTYSDALKRERQIKKWNRQWKIDLIRSVNPEMKDLWPEILEM